VSVLARRIRERAVAWAVAEADHEEIDLLNILQATLLAMKRALVALHAAAIHDHDRR
jgi:ribonuclease HII